MTQTREEILEGKRRWQQANPEKAREAAARYRALHPEKAKEAQRRFDAKRVRDLDERREYQRQWRAANAEKVREDKKRWAAENPDKVKASKKASRARNRPYWTQYFAEHVDNRRQALFANAKRRAKVEGIPFDLVYSEVVWPEVCPVLGIPINYELKGRVRKDDSPSFDRTIPSLGYTTGNVVVMSWRANWIKTNSTIEECSKLLEYLKKVRSH
jgi:hypothetical protein